MGWFRHLSESVPKVAHASTHCCFVASHMQLESALHVPAVLYALPHLDPHVFIALFQPHLSLEPHCVAVVSDVHTGPHRLALASYTQSARALQSAWLAVVAQLVVHALPVQ